MDLFPVAPTLQMLTAAQQNHINIHIKKLIFSTIYIFPREKNQPEPATIDAYIKHWTCYL